MATVTLYTDYPFVQGGGHMPYFASSAERDNFFNTLKSQSLPTDFQPRQGARLLVSLTFLEAQKYNYCIWTDGAQKLYFFIEDYLYLNDKTTQLIISRDIWNDNQLRAVTNPCNVHRMHMPRWNGSTPLFYPLEEGNPRSLIPIETHSMDGSEAYLYSDVTLFITNKNLASEAHEDGIFYYLTFTPTNGFQLNSGSSASVWINPFSSSFVDDFSKFGVGLSPIIAAYMLPNGLPFINTVSLTSGSFKSTFGTLYTVQGQAVFALSTNSAVYDYNLTITDKPTKNTASGTAFNTNFEPMAFLDNMRPAYITDMLGYPVMSVPKNLLLADNPTIHFDARIRSLNPQTSIQLVLGDGTRAPVTGLTALIGGQGVDIPQSVYYDYVAQQRSQDKNILENNIRSRYIQTAVSSVASAVGGGAQGGMFAAAYGNNETVPAQAAMAGAAGGVVGGVSSLINSYIQTQADRDNFKLNEQKIKNTPTPPIAGDNPQMSNSIGVRLQIMKADDVTLNAVAQQYHYYGYILDTAMPISLKPNRYYWMYLQTKDANITGEVNQNDRNYLQALLNRGLTIWNMNHWVGFGAYQYDNVEY